MTESKLDVSIEAPFVKIVQESIVKSKSYGVTCAAFKSHKKFIEKEVSTCVNKITQAKKAAGNPAAALGALDVLITKLNDLKQKVSRQMSNAVVRESCRSRGQALHSHEEAAGSSPVGVRWRC